MGWPLLPWQRQVIDVACEVLEDGSWAYPTVVVSTPRQAGKSTMLGALLIHRTLALPDHLAWYTAQTGQAARDAWRKWQARVTQRMPGRFRTRYSNGEETVTYSAQESSIRSFPPTERSLHGQQTDTVVIDECWSFTPEQGQALLQAVVPTQATRRRRQLILCSTAGDDASLWLRDWVRKGRDAVAGSSSLAFFEWSAPDDAAHDDPDVWRAFHPGYPALVDDTAMNAALEQFGPVAFSRGYLNRWPGAQDSSFRVGWTACTDLDDRLPPEAPVSFGIDASPGHQAAAIVAAWHDPARSLTFLEVVDHRPGIDWVARRVMQLAAKHRARVAIHRTGPLGHLIEELKRVRTDVRAATSADYGDAVARLHQVVSAATLRHPGDPRLDAAADNALTRRSGDRDLWVRRDLAVDISPLVAATMAVWLAQDPPVTPVVMVRRQ